MDDFFDDIPTAGTKSSSSPASGPGGLLPIVEVPSDITSTTTETESARSGRDSASVRSTARTEHSDHEDTETHRSEDIDESEGESDHESEDIHTGRFSNYRIKPRVKNGRQYIDMTPPDKLLQKSQRKAKRYSKEKKVNKAIKEFIKCTALARIVHGDGHWKLARSHSNLAEAYLELKGYAPQAQYHCEMSKTIMSSSIQTSSSSTDKANILEASLNTHYILGRAQTILKKLNEAEQSLTRAEKISKERSKIASVTDDDLDDWEIKIFQAIAKLSAKQQKHAMAITYFEKALDLMETKFGEDSAELIPVYQGMGLVEQSKGLHANHEKAIENFLQAHSIASGYYKDNSIEVANTAHALAGAYSTVGTEDAETSAESYLNECLAVYQTVYGPHHQKTVEIQDELARLMVRTDRPEEAISLFKSTVESKKEVYGDLSGEVANAWKLIGSIHLSQGDPEKALRSLKKCHNVECAFYGSNHKSSKETQRTMDILLANPSLKAKQKKTKEDELKDRPRFNSIVNRGSAVGGFKSQ